MREIRERKKDIDRKVNRRKREECVCARREELADERSGEGEKRRADGAVNEHAAPREERRGEGGRVGDSADVGEAARRRRRRQRRIWWGGTDRGGARHAEGPASGRVYRRREGEGREEGA